MSQEQQAPSWADPTPAGLFAVAAGTTAVWALTTGRLGIENLSTFIVWLFGAAFILLIVGLINLRRGDTLSGSLNLSFGILFFGVPALSYALLLWGGTPLAELGIVNLPTVACNGWVFFILAIVLATFIPIMARQSKIMASALVIFVVAIVLLALFTLQPITSQIFPGTWHTIGEVAGWGIGIAGLIMLYLGMAMALLYAFGRAILPIR